MLMTFHFQLRQKEMMKTSLAFIVFLLWVVAITFSPLACGDGCSKEQTRALLEIRNSTNGFAFPGWDGRDCCLAPGIWCDVENGRVVSIILEEAPSNITWYPNVTLFTLFDDLEELGLYNTQIGGGLERENSYLISSSFFVLV